MEQNNITNLKSRIFRTIKIIIKQTIVNNTNPISKMICNNELCKFKPLSEMVRVFPAPMPNNI